MSALDISRIETLPALAWIARVSGPRARFTCGTGVRLDGAGVFEGAWSDAHGAESPAQATEVFGSGLCFEQGDWVATPPSHLLECLYLLRGAEGWVVSNSLALLRAETGFAFTMTGRALLGALAEAAASLRTAPTVIPTTHGDLHLVYHHNVRLRGAAECAPKPPAPAFARFEDYRRYLLDTLNAVSRQTGRRFLAAVSSGYDSVACAALLHTLGSGEAVSFRRARGGGDDSGAEIARGLGLAAVEFDRPTGVEATTLAPFLCAGLGGEDALYAALAERLNGRIFVTGFHGDKIWDLSAAPNAMLRRGDLSGASLGEFRLQRDFVHVPVPFIGGLRHPELDAIARSPELERYRVGGSYDRPIARRLAEEAGVPRGAFGVRKRAVSLHSVSRDAGAAPPTARLHHLAGVAAWRLMHGGARRLGPLRRPALAASEWLFPRAFGQPFVVFEHADPAAEAAFAAALETVSARYRASLRGRRPAYA